MRNVRLWLVNVHPTDCHFALPHRGNVTATLHNAPSFFSPSILPFFLPPCLPFLAIFTVGNEQKEPSRSGFSVILWKVHPQVLALVPLSPVSVSSASHALKRDQARWIE